MCASVTKSKLKLIHFQFSCCVVIILFVGLCDSYIIVLRKLSLVYTNFGLSKDSCDFPKQSINSLVSITVSDIAKEMAKVITIKLPYAYSSALIV